jgi:hypothetical protein
MTYEEFKNTFETEILPNKPKFIRDGQALMNYLAQINIEEYKRLASVHYYNIDCYYNDSLIPNTWKHLEENWK